MTIEQHRGRFAEGSSRIDVQVACTDNMTAQMMGPQQNQTPMMGAIMSKPMAMLMIVMGMNNMLQQVQHLQMMQMGHQLPAPGQPASSTENPAEVRGPAASLLASSINTLTAGEKAFGSGGEDVEAHDARLQEQGDKALHELQVVGRFLTPRPWLATDGVRGEHLPAMGSAQQGLRASQRGWQSRAADVARVGALLVPMAGGKSTHAQAQLASRAPR